jgi:hypothetical protein
MLILRDARQERAPQDEVLLLGGFSFCTISANTGSASQRAPSKNAGCTSPVRKQDVDNRASTVTTILHARLEADDHHQFIWDRSPA